MTLQKLFFGRYNFLLISLTTLFIFRPFSQNIWYLGLWKLLLTATIIATVFNCKHPKSIKIIETFLAVPAVLLTWASLWWRIPLLALLNTNLNIFFTLLATGSIIYDVIVRKKVTFELLRGVICAFFLVAIGFAYTFWLIEYFYHGSFFLKFAPDLEPSLFGQYLSQMLYFSFVTFLAIGYGDIVAVTPMSQTVVVIEGLFGQFYMAILVGRLVSIYSLEFQLEFIDFFKKKKKE